jgi:hypothetical protein
MAESKYAVQLSKLRRATPQQTAEKRLRTSEICRELLANEYLIELEFSNTVLKALIELARPHVEKFLSDPLVRQTYISIPQRLSAENDALLDEAQRAGLLPEFVVLSQHVGETEANIATELRLLTMGSAAKNYAAKASDIAILPGRSRQSVENMYEGRFEFQP